MGDWPLFYVFIAGRLGIQQTRELLTNTFGQTASKDASQPVKNKNRYLALLDSAMPLLSELFKEKPAESQRHLYTLFQGAVKAGELPALKLLTRFEIQGAKGQPRQVADYAFTQASQQHISDWLGKSEAQKVQRGLTAEQVQAMTDEQLSALIQQQHKPLRKRRTKKEKPIQIQPGMSES